jgi:hypothetical protein
MECWSNGFSGILSILIDNDKMLAVLGSGFCVLNPEPWNPLIKKDIFPY